MEKKKNTLTDEKPDTEEKAQKTEAANQQDEDKEPEEEAAEEDSPAATETESRSRKSPEATVRMATDQPALITEEDVVQNIIIGSDWRDVLAGLVAQEGMDPLKINIIKLSESFMVYLKRLTDFDFRVPARFILIAAILLRMKMELLLEEEEEKVLKTEQLPPINIENIRPLSSPLVRKPTRKVTLDELIHALNKVFEFKERKEGRNIRMKRAVETLIEPAEDIELKIRGVYKKVFERKRTTLSRMVPAWQRKAIVEVFMPLLYLFSRSQIEMEQEEFFKDITVTLKQENREQKDEEAKPPSGGAEGRAEAARRSSSDHSFGDSSSGGGAKTKHEGGGTHAHGSILEAVA